MRFGLDIAQQRMPWDEVVRRVRFAEDLGFDGAWGFDHFQPMYGDGPGEAFEGMTTLAALAGVTSRIRLGLLVTGVTYRHPSVFAAQAITIDHASHGRLELSLGAAWFEKEHPELGIPFPSTPARASTCSRTRSRSCTRLFTGDVVSYDGRVGVVARRAAAARAGAAAAPADLDRRQRAPPHAPARRQIRGRVARVGNAELVAGHEHGARRARRRGRVATRRRSCGRARSHSTISTPPASTLRNGARPATATSCAVGPKLAEHRSRRSPVT